MSVQYAYLSSFALVLYNRTHWATHSSENAMQASNHASNLKATEFLHRIAVHTRDWLTSFQDSLAEIRKQHLMFMSKVFTKRNGVPTDVHIVEEVDEQFRVLFVRSKDVERV